MTIRDQAIHEARVHFCVEELVAKFDLGWLKVIVKFTTLTEDTDRIICETKSDWEYRQCSLIWNLHQVSSLTDDELEETAVHELVHAINAPLWGSLTDAQQDKLEKHNELATENVARVISHLLKK